MVLGCDVIPDTFQDANIQNRKEGSNQPTRSRCDPCDHGNVIPEQSKELVTCKDNLVSLLVFMIMLGALRWIVLLGTSLLVSSSMAFVVTTTVSRSSLSCCQTKSRWCTTCRVANEPNHFTSQSEHEGDMYLARLYQDFHDLQNELLQDLKLAEEQPEKEMYFKDDAEELAEEMMEKLLSAASIRKYQQLQELDRVDHYLVHARDDKERAHQLKESVHDEEESLQKFEVDMIEMIDNDRYEDVERARELAKIHADEHVEQDAEVLELQSEYHMELAEQQRAAILKSIQQLQDYQDHLQASLQDMRRKKVKDWKEHSKEQSALMVKHKDFLDHIQASIENDPYLSTQLSVKDKLFFRRSKATLNELGRSKRMVVGTNQPLSLDHQLEASIDNDPDLSISRDTTVSGADTAQKPVSTTKTTESLSTSIPDVMLERSIDDDPYLSFETTQSVMKNRLFRKRTKATEREISNLMEELQQKLHSGDKTDKDPLQASIDEDPYLSSSSSSIRRMDRLFHKRTKATENEITPLFPK